MVQIVRSIIEKQTLRPALWQLSIGLEEIDQAAGQIIPGQFFLVQCEAAHSTYLRRAIFPIKTVFDPSEKWLRFLFSPADLTDPGLAWLISRQIGHKIDLLGPFGQGFPQPNRNENILLIGSGPQIGPLLFLLTQALKGGANVVLALEATRSGDLYPTQDIPPAVELHLATSDGSQGYRGSILDHLGDLPQWADAVCAVGSRPFYARLKTLLNQTRLTVMEKFASVLINDRPLHICGNGLCTLCTLPTTAGLKLACQDGPIFDLAILPSEER